MRKAKSAENIRSKEIINLNYLCNRLAKMDLIVKEWCRKGSNEMLKKSHAFGSYMVYWEGS